MGITSAAAPDRARRTPTASTDDAQARASTSTVDSVNMRADLHAADRDPEARRRRRAAAPRCSTQAQCAVCHVPSLHTRADYPIAPLADIDAPVFTDLLLHDMGDGARRRHGRRAGRRRATGARRRSSACASTARCMHDGRAETVEEAILAHGATAPRPTAASRVRRALAEPTAPRCSRSSSRSEATQVERSDLMKRRVIAPRRSVRGGRLGCGSDATTDADRTRSPRDARLDAGRPRRAARPRRWSCRPRRRRRPDAAGTRPSDAAAITAMKAAWAQRAHRLRARRGRDRADLPRHRRRHRRALRRLPGRARRRRRPEPVRRQGRHRHARHRAHPLLGAASRRTWSRSRPACRATGRRLPADGGPGRGVQDQALQPS